MAVDTRTTLQIVKQEVAECEEYARLLGWEISKVDEEKQLFTVKMKSPIDQNEYLIEVRFDQYKALPLFIEFIDPVSGERGIPRAYPKSVGNAGSFFHPNPCICHPCSRKAYKVEGGPQGPHADWNMSGWQQNEKVGSLTSILAILLAIYSRVSNAEHYGGRMNG